MKVLNTIPNMYSRSGGPTTCTYNLMEGLYDISPGTVELLTIKSKASVDNNIGSGRDWMIETDDDRWSPLEMSSNIVNFLEASESDVYHTNTLWKHTNHATCKIARQKGKPIVLSPHGMLYPTAMQIKSWKKRPMLALWFRKDILNASCLHVTCMEEMRHCRDFGYQGPIAVIPNPVVIPDSMPQSARQHSPKAIGFLGRLNPIKKVENILYAAAMIDDLDFEIVIMGKGEPEYENFLITETKRLNIEHMVRFTGFVTGNEKYRLLSQLRALMVPSIQENFGMIVPEALLSGTPVYASLGTPWSELNGRQCGWWRDNAPETIAATIREIMSMEESQIMEMGIRGRNLIHEKYEYHQVATMMLDLYRWLAGEIEKPSYIYCE